MQMAYKTKFVPKHKNKYIGNPEKITCRSLWERRVCEFLDQNVNVIKWSFETTKIRYINPHDKKFHNYIPDFIVQMKKDGKIVNYIWEVKPEKQTYLKENAKASVKKLFEVNYAKWEAADEFCKKHGMKFEILTERHIFHAERL